MMPNLLIGALGLMGLGIAMFAALRLIYGHRSGVLDPVFKAIRIIGIVLVGIGWLALLLLMANLFGVLLFATSVVIAVTVWWQLCLLRRRTHLALIALAIEKQIPLPACIRAYADEERGFFARFANDFADQLQSGVPLPTAVGESYGVLPSFAAMATRVGTACDCLAPALRQEFASDNNFTQIRRSIASRTLYLCIATSVVPAILSFMMIKIIPAMIRIFNDFEVELPVMTQTLIFLCEASVVFTGFFALAFLLGLVVTVYASIWYMGFRLPVPFPIGPLAIRFDRSAVLRALAFPAEQARPLDRIIDLLALYYPRSAVRRRLSRVSDRIEDGQNWLECLRKESLVGKAEVAVLKAAERVGNLPWALREMAASNERRLIHRLEAIVQVLTFVTVLIFWSVNAGFEIN